MMKEHLIILELAEQGKLPARIDGASDLSVALVEELIDAGYLKAFDASSLSGPAYLDPKITLAGREYLAELREGTEAKHMQPKKQKEPPLASAKGIPDVRGAWLKIDSEYDVSKRSFGRKINFVEDPFTRRVIYRDIGQAFLLARHGFNKPAVVLAGGVIEELLRLYLGHKKVVPSGNNLDSYIRACEERNVLKGAINKLADSVRQFRNIVHLERESSAKNTISKATAKAAVASVFTIANDFGP
jgi:hypothetical protein